MQKEAPSLPQDWGSSGYKAFLEREQLPVLNGLAVDDLAQVEVGPWPRLEASNVEGLPTSFDLRYRACYHTGGET